jgi:hypothetical protein
MMIMVGIFQAIQGLARTVAIFLAVLSAIANFAFIPYYPFWSLLIIALDVFVIWAVAAHGGELRDRV